MDNKIIKHSNFQFDKDLIFNITNATQSLLNEARKQEEELFTTALRTIANPPVKGDITKEELTSRGIRIVRQQIGFDSYSWLEQRGERISRKFHLKINTLDD